MQLDSLLDEAAKVPDITIAVAAAEDQEIISAVCEAAKRGIASFLLFGNKEKIEALLQSTQVYSKEVQGLTIHSTGSIESAAIESVKAVRENKADVLMKGMIPTADLLKAVLNPEYGLRTKKILSHVSVFDIPENDRLLFLTDAGMNIAPALKAKVEIINNAVSISHSLGYNNPKVAVIAAVEVINEKMNATLDAAVLTQMNRRGQINGCIVDGPLAFDNAVSTKAVEYKGIHSDVAGYADILAVPTIEVGNALYKSFVYFAKAKVGAVVAGAKAPIVLTSRADSAESKFYSIALAVLSAQQHKGGPTNGDV